MKRWLWGAALGVIFLATPAQAQFQNKSIGLNFGYLNPFSTGPDAVVLALPIGITFTYYIENHFDLVFEGDAILARQNQDVNPATNIFGFKVVPIGFRYLFTEEAFRPYVGVDLSFTYLFTSAGPSAVANASVLGGVQNQYFVGLSPNVGFDYFVADNLSLGLKARFDLDIALNSVGESFDVTARIATYF
jgi:outer membrane protein W